MRTRRCKSLPVRALGAILLALGAGCSGGPNASDASAQIRDDLRYLELGFKQYDADRGAYPARLEQLVGPDVVYPRTEPRPEMPTDPWGNPYVYVAPSDGGHINLICLGADARPGGEGLAADVELRSFKSRAR